MLHTTGDARAIDEFAVDDVSGGTPFGGEVALFTASTFTQLARTAAAPIVLRRNPQSRVARLT